MEKNAELVEGLKRRKDSDTRERNKRQRIGEFERKNLLDGINEIGRNKVPEILAMAIRNLQDQLNGSQDQLKLTSMHMHTRHYSREKQACEQAIEKIASLKENKIEEAIEGIQGIIKNSIDKKDLYSFKAIEAIWKAIEDLSIWAWDKEFGPRQYDATFAAIPRSTVEKTQSQMAVGALLSKLGDKDAFGEGKVKISDIGSHDGDTLRRILGNSGKLGEVLLYGMDYKKGCGEEFKKNLQQLRSEGITVSSINTVDGPEKGNAYSGDISASFEIPRRSINVALVSHLAYGVTLNEIEKLVTDISSNLLSSDGIGIFLHVKEDQDSILLNLRNKYGERAEVDMQASKDKVTKPSQEIAELAKKLGCSVKEISYRVKTYFDRLSDEEWKKIEDLKLDDIDQLQNRENQKLIDNILRISFFALRTPQDIMQDTSKGTWSTLVNSVRQAVRSTETITQEGYTEDTVSMQILLPPHASEAVKNVVEDAAQRVKENISDIKTKAEREVLSQRRREGNVSSRRG